VDVDDNTVVEDDCKVSIGSVVKVGKRRFMRIAIDNEG
jgi:hypothetical protein